MLLNLHVKNLALIEETEVEFKEGLNILSGETGAGKSIIIGSLNLALGEKVPKEMLRENAEYALVELVFGVENEYQKQQLAKLDIFPEEGQVIMSRKITAARSVGRINSESVPASKMRAAASLLIDIHGQHEHQSLLHAHKHLEILDEFAKDALKGKKETLKEAYRQYQSLKKEMNEAVTDESQRARELSFLEYEIQELEEASLRPGEDEELETEYKRLLHGRKILEAAGLAHEWTAGGTNGADQQIGRALKELLSVAEYDGALDGIVQQLTDIDSLLNDFNRELSTYQADAEFSQEDFEKVEQRLDLLNHLKSKYGGTIEAMLEQKLEKEKRYETLKNYENYLEELSQKEKAAEEKLKNLCEKVSGIRKKQAKALTKQVTQSLSELNFLDVTFTMEFSKTEEYTANGTDEARFLISTNPGEPVKPLGKVASGGELSRIMLAIKTILAENDLIETMIFDEIDAGISGRTAQMVAEKMNVIGKNHQVICITHLPQIAAMADHHFLIEKSVVDQSTISTIKPLSEEESIGELARMIGGVKVTDTVEKSAREMKELALAVKKKKQ